MILIALTISIYFAAFFQIKIFIGSISTYRWHFRIRELWQDGNRGRLSNLYRQEIWSVAAWEVYKVTGDKDWLK